MPGCKLNSTFQRQHDLNMQNTENSLEQVSEIINYIKSMRRNGNWEHDATALCTGKVQRVISSPKGLLDMYPRSMSGSSDQVFGQERIERQLVTQTLFENTGSATVILLEDLTIQQANTDFFSFSGCSHREVEAGIFWIDLVHPGDREKVLQYHRNRCRGKSAPRKYEFRFLTRKGQIRHVSATVSLVPTIGTRIVSLNDITALHEARHEISAMATYDSLTGILNREQFLKRLDSALKEKNRQEFSVVLLDLSRFRVVNEVFGYHIGDRLLCEFAARLTKAVSTGDLVARFSGDQFLLLFRNVPDSERFSGRYMEVCSALAKPYLANEGPVFLRFRAGVVLSRGRSAAEKSEIIQNAITSMHSAKLEGTDYWIYSGCVVNTEREKLTLEVELIKALQDESITLSYQPVYRLSDRGMVGFEALARWTSPRTGTVPPDVFVALAEERGLIMSLGRLLLRKACTQLRKWENAYAEHPPRVAVNISGIQLLHPDFLATVRMIIHETGCTPTLLTIEITESSIIRDLEKTRQVVDTLRSMGIAVVLDDFGTGYSSLTHLQKLSLDAIKIDKSFVSRLGKDDIVDPDIVKALISLGSGLGLEVVAEGIETPAQLATLRDWGVDHGQGFYFSKAVQEEQATAIFSQMRSTPSKENDTLKIPSGER